MRLQLLSLNLYSGGFQMKEQMSIERLSEENMTQAKVFIKEMVVSTFEENELGHMTALIQEEVDSKIRMLHQDASTNGEEVFFLFAKRRGQIVASISLAAVNPLIISCTHDLYQNKLEVGSVFVRPDLQNKGIARFMMTLIQEELHRRGHSDFCFDSGYPIAQKIWTKLYGQPAYIEEDFWGKGSPHMIWHLSVSLSPNKILPILP